MGSAEKQPTPLLLVSGMNPEHVALTAAGVRGADPAGTALVHHDLRELGHGVVHRTVRHGFAEHSVALELVHGCVSCTLREDLLPLLRALAAAPDVTRIVLRLDPAIDPETICWALRHIVIDGGTLERDVEVRSVLTTVDLSSWLVDATGAEELAERGLAGSPDDERTVAQLTVGQVEFADALVLVGTTADRWYRARTEAVLRRLTPNAPWTHLEELDADALLDRVPPTARRGEIDGPHGPLLRGQPPLEAESGVATVLFEHRRPFHPGRLHAAVDVLLDGVVRARGRVWVASQPDTMLWVESAGGGLGIAPAGTWLAADDSQPADVDPEWQVRAALHWDEYYGDRVQELVVLTYDADPEDIRQVLEDALLTDAELVAGRRAWAAYGDPFEPANTGAGGPGEEPAVRATDGVETET